MKFIIESHGFRFGPFETIDAAYEWGRERAKRISNDDSLVEEWPPFTIAELRSPCEWGNK